MARLQSNSHKLLRRFLTLAFIFFLVMPTSIPIFLFILSPMYIYRGIIWIFKWIFRPDLRKFVNCRSALFASDLFNEKVANSNLLVSFVFDGVISKEKLIEDIQKNLISCVKADKKNELVLPEMSQAIEMWCGFAFWKKYEFQIEDHLECVGNEAIFEQDLLKIRNSLDRKPWPRDRSPWRLTLVPNYHDNDDLSVQKSALIAQFNHTLSDGFSILILILKKLLNVYEESEIQNPEYLEKSIWGKIVDTMLFPIRAPYQGLGQFFKSYDGPELKLKGLPEDCESFVASSEKIPISKIKEIKKNFDASFTSILASILAAGLRKFYKKNCLNVPENVHMMVPFPIKNAESNRKDKLRNMYSCAFLRLPTGLSSPQDRVFQSEKNLKFLKTSLIPLINFLSIPFIGLLPQPAIKLIFSNVVTTGLLSNFPGPRKWCKFQGLKLSDVQFSGGPGPGTAGVGFTMISYNENLRLNIFLAKSICSCQQDADDLLQFIVDELDILKSVSCTSTKNDVNFNQNI